MATDINKDKLKALQLTMDKMEKTFGKGAVMKLGDGIIEQVDVIPSGSIGLDIALGIGGYPKGRIVEIYGPESSGKTTLAIHAIAEAQRKGGIAAMIDAEHAFDRTYAESLGVDTENLLISQPDNGEQALEIADNLIRSGAIDIIVIDSGRHVRPPSRIGQAIQRLSIAGLLARWLKVSLETSYQRDLLELDDSHLIRIAEGQAEHEPGADGVRVRFDELRTRTAQMSLANYNPERAMNASRSNRCTSCSFLSKAP